MPKLSPASPPPYEQLHEFSVPAYRSIARAVRKEPREYNYRSPDALTVEELNLLYASPVYTEGFRSRCGEAAFWLPLLSQFTGGRYKNLCHLQVCHVQQHDGVWSVLMPDMFPIRPPIGSRWVPLHPALVDIGWLDYVASCRPRGDTAWLFPDLFASSSDYVRVHARPWFGRYLRRAGLDETRLDFASFRYTFAAFAGRSGVDDKVIREILGYPSTVSHGRPEASGGSLRFERFVDAIDKLDFPGLAIGHLVRHSQADR